MSVKKEYLATVKDDRYGVMRILIGCGRVKYAAEDACRTLGVDPSHIKQIKFSNIVNRSVETDTDNEELTFVTITDLQKVLDKNKSLQTSMYKKWIKETAKPKAEHDAAGARDADKDYYHFTGIMTLEEFKDYLVQNNVHVSYNQMCRWLRKRRYLRSRKGELFNYPTEPSVTKHLFTTERVYSKKWRKHFEFVKVTPKGRDLFLEEMGRDFADGNDPFAEPGSW